MSDFFLLHPAWFSSLTHVAYFKIYIVFIKFNLNCCSNNKPLLWTLVPDPAWYSIQKSNCILLTGIAGYGAFESIWCWGNFGPSSAFSSSRRFRQAAFGLRLRSIKWRKIKSIRFWIGITKKKNRWQITSNLLLERHNHFNSHVKYSQFSLRFVGLQVCTTHSAKLFKRFINISDPYSSRIK